MIYHGTLYQIKMDTIWYYLLPNSTTIELTNEKYEYLAVQKVYSLYAIEFGYEWYPMIFVLII